MARNTFLPACEKIGESRPDNNFTDDTGKLTVSRLENDICRREAFFSVLTFKCGYPAMALK
jgi:hypothetical protein